MEIDITPLLNNYRYAGCTLRVDLDKCAVKITGPRYHVATVTFHDARRMLDAIAASDVTGVDVLHVRFGSTVLH